MEAARHAAFIWWAYGATGLAVAGLVLRAALDHRAQAKALAALETRAARSPEPGAEAGGG